VKLSKGALFSPGEIRTDHALQQFFQKKPYVVYKEFPVRRVIDVEEQELSKGEWDYYSKASFDFLVCNRDDKRTWEIAIEFDGKQHRMAKQARKDALKDRLCLESGLPLLRVQSDYVEPLGGTTLLEYMLDLYFGEKALDNLKGQGQIAEDEEYFIGTTFPGTARVVKKLMQKGVAPAAFVAFVDNRYGSEEASRVVWLRVSHRSLDRKPQRHAHGNTGGASVQVEILRGDSLLFRTEKEVCLRECSPNKNVLGVHTWHIAQELAEYLALVEVEKLVDKLGKRLTAEGRIQ
jgi:hypothetical protein